MIKANVCPIGTCQIGGSGKGMLISIPRNHVKKKKITDVVDLLLGQRHRQLDNIKSILGQHLMFSGILVVIGGTRVNDLYQGSNLVFLLPLSCMLILLEVKCC